MYGLPENLDLSFFVGKTLHVISFTANTVTLRFDDPVSLTIESAFQHQYKVDAEHDLLGTMQSVYRISSSSLMQVLGHTVISAIPEADGALSLQFDDGQVFRCLETSKAYECYHITRGDETWII